MKQLFSAFIIGIIVCFIAVKSCNDKPQQVNVKEVKKEIKTSGNLVETLHQNYQKAKQEFNKIADSLKLKCSVVCKYSFTACHSCTPIPSKQSNAFLPAGNPAK